MKNLYSVVLSVLLVASSSLIGVSCKKEQKAALPPTPPPTPEQRAVIEEMKQEANLSTEQAKTIVVAQVNGVDITMLDLIGEMNVIAQREKAKGRKEQNDKTMAQDKNEALDNLIFKELAVQEATKKGITVLPDRVDTIVKLMKEQAGSKEAFKKYLDERKMTEADLRKRIGRSLVFEIITGKEIYQMIKVDDKEIRTDYEKNKSQYKDKKGKQLSYEETANLIRKNLISEKGDVLKRAWAEKLRNDASVVVFKEAMK